MTEVTLTGGQGRIKAAIPTRAEDKGRPVNVGIRPEDMVEATGDAYAFKGKVEIVEALGEVTQLYFAIPKGDESPVIAKLPGIHTGLRGNEMKMTAVPEKLHLFMNGKSLLYR